LWGILKFLLKLFQKRLQKRPAARHKKRLRLYQRILKGRNKAPQTVALAPARQLLLMAGEFVFFMPGELYRPNVAVVAADNEENGGQDSSQASW